MASATMSDRRKARKRLLRLLWMQIFVVIVVCQGLILWQIASFFTSGDINTKTSTSSYLNKFITLPGTRKALAPAHEDFNNIPQNHSKIVLRLQQKQESTGMVERILPKSTFTAAIRETPTRPEDASFVKLRQQGVEIPKDQVDNVPTWSQIINIFGSEPVIQGLDTCEAYRQAVPLKDRVVAVAGMFNTGTNLFPLFFTNNCQSPYSKRALQVPWGKHNLAAARTAQFHLNRTKYQNVSFDHVMPIVMIRHPLSWMFSTCVHSYGAHWRHNATTNCPNLIHKDKVDGPLVSVGVTHGYNPNGKKSTRYRSLIHLWRDWYQSYLGNISYAKQNGTKIGPTIRASFPRLIIRLEDVVYQPEKVLISICDCVGMTSRRNATQYIPVQSVKEMADKRRERVGKRGSLANGKKTAGLLQAWILHASIARLWKRMTNDEQKLVKQVLQPIHNTSSTSTSKVNNPKTLDMMKLFNYNIDGSVPNKTVRR